MSTSADTPEQLRYTSEHEWVAVGADWKVGITAYAQDSLGDIVFVQLPEVGSAVDAGDSIGEIESTKSVSELYAPIAGTVAARNDALDEQPELINTDPYGQGWILRIDPSDPAAGDKLLDAAAYRQLIEGQG